jgi:hypothetical protein
MTWLKDNYQGLIVGAALATVALLFTAPANAADLGGNCCADLEERIAELEATTARKGNRKVSVTISGWVSQGVLWLDDGDDDTKWSVGTNSNVPNYLQIAGSAQIAPNGLLKKAGFVVQISYGDYDASIGGNGLAYGHLGNGPTHELGSRKVYAFVKGDFGTVSLGRMSMATDGSMKATNTNTWVATTPLCLQPLIGENGVGDALSQLICGDGGISDGVRYDSPVFNGIQVSAFVGPGNAEINGTDTNPMLWDIAAKYSGDITPDIAVAAAIGYRNGLALDDELFGTPISLTVKGVKVWSGSAEVKHATGWFVGGAAFKTELAGVSGDLTGYSVKGGHESKFLTPLGASTVYAEWGQWELSGAATEPEYIGLGFIQSIESANMYLSLSGRQYDVGGSDDITAVMGAMTIGY